MMDRYGDLDGDGLEYARSNERGLIQQGWKDSHDSIFHADGRMAIGPIATRELVRLCGARSAAESRRCSATRRGAGPGAARGGPAARLRCGLLGRGARHLRAGARRREAALPGTRLERRPRAVGGSRFPSARRGWPTLLSDASFSGWGIRTVAAGEARATTRSRTTTARSGRTTRHRGHGPWPYGQHDRAARLLAGLFDASHTFDLARLPELFCGFTRRHGEDAPSGRLLASGLGRGLGLHAAAGGPWPGGRRAAQVRFRHSRLPGLPGRPVGHRPARRRCHPGPGYRAPAAGRGRAGRFVAAATSR